MKNFTSHVVVESRDGLAEGVDGDESPSCSGPLTPCLHEYIEKLIFCDFSKIFKNIRWEVVVANALRYPIRIVKRKPFAEG